MGYCLDRLPMLPPFKNNSYNGEHTRATCLQEDYTQYAMTDERVVESEKRCLSAQEFSTSRWWDWEQCFKDCLKGVKSPISTDYDLCSKSCSEISDVLQLGALPDVQAQQKCFESVDREYRMHQFASQYAAFHMSLRSLGKYTDPQAVCGELGKKAAGEVECECYHKGIGADPDMDWTVISYGECILGHVAKTDPDLVMAAKLYAEGYYDGVELFRKSAVKKLTL